MSKPALGYCKVCGKPLEKKEVTLCTRCLSEEQAGAKDYS